MTDDLARRRSLLTAALAFALLRTRDGCAPPETEGLEKWLDTWRGVGRRRDGNEAQGYTLNLSDGRFGACVVGARK